MKRLLASLILTTAMVALSGCYIDPGYSYVRQNGYQGDAYYGRGVRVYDDGYYYAAPVYGGYYGGGYGYGCCYAPGVTLGISGVWYGDSYYRGGRNGYRVAVNGGAGMMVGARRTIVVMTDVAAATAATAGTVTDGGLTATGQ